MNGGEGNELENSEQDYSLAERFVVVRVRGCDIDLKRIRIQSYDDGRWRGRFRFCHSPEIGSILILVPHRRPSTRPAVSSAIFARNTIPPSVVGRFFVLTQHGST